MILRVEVPDFLEMGYSKLEEMRNSWFHKTGSKYPYRLCLLLPFRVYESASCLPQAQLIIKKELIPNKSQSWLLRSLLPLSVKCYSPEEWGREGKW